MVLKDFVAGTTDQFLKRHVTHGGSDGDGGGWGEGGAGDRSTDAK